MLLFKRLSISLFIGIILISCSSNEGDNEYRRLEKRAENVTIIRDNWGVPHIYAKKDADAVFGLLYAQCEDDFNRVEVNYINAMGRMAEVTGEEMIFTDLRMKLFIDPEAVKEEYENSPKWLKELMQGFADG